MSSIPKIVFSAGLTLYSGVLCGVTVLAGNDVAWVTRAVLLESEAVQHNSRCVALGKAAAMALPAPPHHRHLLRRVVQRRLAVPGIIAAAALGVLAVVPAPSAGAAALATPRHAAKAAALVSDPASLVNPFIGTTDSEDDFPGADVPFGMVQWSPDTPSRPEGGGYEYNDSSITGFSLDHLSGPGCGAEGDIPVLPTVGAVDTSATDSFSHSNESAEAGEYQVALDNGVTTALTATTRTGMADFTFPSSTEANLIFNLDGSQNPDTATSFTVVSDTEVQGSATSGDFCGAGNTYTLYFDMQFSQPFTTSGTFSGSTLHAGVRNLSLKQPASAKAKPSTVPASKTEKPDQPVYHGALPAKASDAAALTGPAGTYLTFNTTSDQTVLAKVGVSYVSTANALANLTAENSGWNFSATESAAQASWNALLGKVQIAGGTAAEQTTFYTALYHSLLHPNVFSDDNGQYMGVDGKVHTVDSGHSAFYTNFSGWDIYRTQAQLEALLDPQAASDTAESMVDDYAQDGMLPKWMEDNGETYVMVGDPAESIISDYYAVRATNLNTSAALTDMISEATSTTSNIRPGNNYLSTPGYLPADGSYGCCNFYGPVS